MFAGDLIKTPVDQLNHLLLYTLGAHDRSSSLESLFLRTQECTAELSFRRRQSAPPTQTNHSRSHRRRRPLSHTLTDRPAAHPRDGTLTRAPLWPPIPCTSPTARRSDVGGGGTQPRHAASSTAAFSGLPRARLRGRDGPCPALHVRTRRLGRSLRTAQPSRSTSTQRAPPALTAAVAAPPPCRSPREFVRRRPRLHPGLATGAPGRRRRGRPSEGEGSVSDGSSPPRAPLPIVPPRRHHARTLGEGRFT